MTRAREVLGSVRLVATVMGGYALAAAATAAASFLAVPLLIRSLGSTEFGRWALLEPLLLLLAPTALVGTSWGVFKHVSHDGHAVLPTVNRLFRGVQAPVLAAGVLASLMLVRMGYSTSVAISFAVLLYIESYLTLLLAGARAGDLVGAFASGSMVRPWVVLLVVALGLQLPLLGIRHVDRLVLLRLAGALLAVAVILAILRGRRYRPKTAGSRDPGEQATAEPASTKHFTRDAIVYGGPILVATLLGMVIEFADRYILKAYFDYDTLARYVIYIKIAAILDPVLIAPFGLWWPSARFRRLRDADEGNAFFRDTAAVLLLLLLLAGGVLWIVSPEVVEWFAPGVALEPDLLLVLILAVVCRGMAAPMNVGLLNPGRTGANIWGVIVGAVTHVALCMALIPRWGMVGGAWATLAGYFLYAAALNAMSQRAQRVSFRYGRMAVLLVTSIALLRAVGAWSGMAGGSAWRLAAAAGLYVTVVSAIAFTLFQSVVRDALARPLAVR